MRYYGGKALDRPKDKPVVVRETIRWKWAKAVVFPVVVMFWILKEIIYKIIEKDDFT